MHRLGRNGLYVEPRTSDEILANSRKRFISPRPLERSDCRSPSWFLAAGPQAAANGRPGFPLGDPAGRGRDEELVFDQVLVEFAFADEIPAAEGGESVAGTARRSARPAQAAAARRTTAARSLAGLAWRSSRWPPALAAGATT